VNQLTRFEAGLAFRLDEFQLEACQALEAGRSVLVAAPTGSGKTIVGEFAIHLAIAAGGKAFYTTPIKALSNQKYRDLVARYGSDKVGLLTGDTSINSTAQVVVMTTEVLRNMLYVDSSLLTGLQYVIVDEVHYLADKFRGPVWEEVIIHLPTHVALVALSATVSNAAEFGDWLATVRAPASVLLSHDEFDDDFIPVPGSEIVQVVVSSHRPVPLWNHVAVAATAERGLPQLLDLFTGRGQLNPELTSRRRTDPNSKPFPNSGSGRARDNFRTSGGSRGGNRSPVSRVRLVESLDHAGLLPAVCFIFSRAGCEAALDQLFRSGVKLNSAATQQKIRKIVEARVGHLPQVDLELLGYWRWSAALQRGIAAHHAGLLPVFKEVVEELFSAGLVKVVFATETLALGINMPARTVVLEKLDKWDGTSHNPLTPGEYTQLTGRAGRRGIDVEGHAVVVDHGGFEPSALAALATKKNYPLVSAFTPTYNMAVNVISQSGFQKAREILETSFAQFQADRSVVEIAQRLRALEQTLDTQKAELHCEKGNALEYFELRRELTKLEKQKSQSTKLSEKVAAAKSLEKITKGEVVLVTSATAAANRYRSNKDHNLDLLPRNTWYAVVVADGRGPEHRGGRKDPVVLSAVGHLERLNQKNASGGAQVVGQLAHFPKKFTGKTPRERQDLAAVLRSSFANLWAASSSSRKKMDSLPSGRQNRQDGQDKQGKHGEPKISVKIAELKTALAHHPCANCPDLSRHSQVANQYFTLQREFLRLQRRITNQTGTIARDFDKIAGVLQALGYLDEHKHVTEIGKWLRYLYSEQDLLVAQCLRGGIWDELRPAELAAVVAGVVYESRREEENGAQYAGNPKGPVGKALVATNQVFQELLTLEKAFQLETLKPLSFALVEPIRHWANGKPLAEVLAATDLAAGDFVRWCKQVIDVLNQIAAHAPTKPLKDTARAATNQVLRGVVAYASVSSETGNDSAEPTNTGQ
jgi:ATP-dependent RNA helicase HelY